MGKTSSTAINFFHTADVHFGVENYGKIDAKTGIHTRLLDFKNSLENCVNQAIDEKIDFFLFSGDAYKTAYPTPTQQKLLMEVWFKLYKANIPVVIIVGNHDHPLSFGKTNALEVFGNLPVDGFHVFSKPRYITLQTNNGPIQIVGIPWPTRHNLVAKDEHRFKSGSEITEYLSQKVGQIIKHIAGKLDPNVPAVLAGHLTVSTGIFSGSEKCAVFGNDPVLLPSQIAIKPFDYVALGHLHRHQNLNKNGYPAVVYSGSTERVDFGERKEEKGFCKVKISVEKNDNKITKNCSYEFVKLPTRPMIQIEIKLAADKDHTKQLLSEIEKHAIEGAIVKIVYHVPEGKKDRVDLLAIQRACSFAIYIAGIIPVHKPIVHERRVHMNVDMDFSTLLSTYFDSKKIGVEEKANLMEKAQSLYNVLYDDDK